jgi:hypothetical protein
MSGGAGRRTRFWTQGAHLGPSRTWGSHEPSPSSTEPCSSQSEAAGGVGGSTQEPPHPRRACRGGRRRGCSRGLHLPPLGAPLPGPDGKLVGGPSDTPRLGSATATGPSTPVLGRTARRRPGRRAAPGRRPGWYPGAYLLPPPPRPGGAVLRRPGTAVRGLAGGSRGEVGRYCTAGGCGGPWPTRTQPSMRRPPLRWATSKRLRRSRKGDREILRQLSS